MRKILRKSVHLKLLKLHRLMGEVIRSRPHFRISLTYSLLERMSDLVINRNSWERRERKR